MIHSKGINYVFTGKRIKLQVILDVMCILQSLQTEFNNSLPKQRTGTVIFVHAHVYVRIHAQHGQYAIKLWKMYTQNSIGSKNSNSLHIATL